MRTPEEKLLNPRPGSKIAAATKFGIDLTLNIGNLRKTPQQRIDDLQSMMRFFVKLDEAREARLRAK